MKHFEGCWPKSFHEPISKKVVTMFFYKKHVKVDDAAVYDTETIYARAMVLQSSQKPLDTQNLVKHELAPMPMSMFDESGHMRDAKTKAKLKTKLMLEVPPKFKADTMFLDGCAILWVIPWPPSGTVQDYLDIVRQYVQKQLKKCDVYLLFDR